MDCKPATNPGATIFQLSIYLVALGYGGHQPTLATFGADQFDESNPKTLDAKSAFFCYFYFALICSSLISLAAAVLALVLYLAVMPFYRYIKPCGNLSPASPRSSSLLSGNARPPLSTLNCSTRLKEPHWPSKAAGRSSTSIIRDLRQSSNYHRRRESSGETPMEAMHSDRS
ncbi:Protein NRT1/ PTR FAMILY 7.1 [Linum grandiflorum]